MAQHDFNIANQGFPAFRADLNNSLSATVSLSAGATEPSTTFAYQLWYDETADVLKIRNDDNDAWITLFTFDQTANTVTVSGEELVDDTTPELGGDLQSNGNDIVMADNDKILLGTGSDGELFHDGSNTIINDAGTGSLKLQQGGSDKLEVTSTGVTITGTAIATTDTDATNTGNITLDFGANQNFVLTLTGNVTLDNPTTEQVGQSGFIVFIQDGTGGRTVSLGTDYETAGGAGLTLSSAASATDIVPYVVAASGRILLGAPQLAFA
jgi:hypothetical protein